MGETTYEAVGNPTECALFRFLQDAEIPIHLEAQEKLGNVLATVPFSSHSKFMATAVKVKDVHGDDMVCVYVKGAPEVVVAMCSSRLQGGEQVQLNRSEHSQIMGVVNTLAQQPLRVLSFGYLQLDVQTWRSNYENSV